LVSEGRLDQALAEPRLARGLIEIGDVPKFSRLPHKRRDQMWVSMTERIDSDAGGKVQVSLSVSCNQPGAFAALKRKGKSGKRIIKSRTGHDTTLQDAAGAQSGRARS